ncbi:MAG: mercuric reductase [Candidatus Dormibacteria bacterium]
MPVENFDAIIVGAGQSGGPLSTALAAAGRRTALVEKQFVGGTCINFGCTPTKTMVASARVAYLARRAADYGVTTGSVSVDMKKVRERKRDIVASFRSGSENHIRKQPGLDFVEGVARFSGPKQLTVHLNAGGTRELTAESIFINVGCRPSDPGIDGIESVGAMDSTSIMELDEVPRHLLVIGGGYIGLEFGQMFRRFGSEVTIVQRGGHLFAREDPDVADEVAKIMREDGITIHFDTSVGSVSGAPGAVDARLTGATSGILSASHLLVAAGRTPNTDLLDPAAAGLVLDERGYIPVNERLETTVPGIYALGDVHGGPAFTHISYDDWRVLRANLIEGGSDSIAGRQVPYTVYIDPQLGRVGMTEAEARASGRPVKVAKMPMTHVARALEVDETRGFMKVVVDSESDEILGCAILGLEGGELMSMLQIAILGKVKVAVLREAVFAHPTLAEAFNNLFGSFED